VLVKYTEPDNLLATIIGRLMVDIARGDSLVRQRSMILSITVNDLESLSRRRGRLEMDTAHYIAGLFNLARDHGLDPLADIHGEELELVRLAVAPLNRKGAVS
jgi:hypothetical protein